MKASFSKAQTTGRRDASTYTVEALAKGLRILALFSERRPLLRLSDIVALTQMPMPTVFRLVATLESEGYVERLADGAVRPSAAVLTLGFAALRGLDIVQTSSVILRELFEKTKQTINLGVLASDNVVYVARLQSDAVLVTANLTIGSTLPAVFTSMGKVLLAFLPDDELAKRVKPASFNVARGPNAVRSMTALKRQLAQVRANGFAIQDEELTAGLRSIAAPVRDESGRIVAAVNVAVGVQDLSIKELQTKLKAPLLTACGQISRRLGARE